jgi:4-methyl-5(b-hydroxyethyl)-thiazole monophosphate biosynthesis
VEVTTAGLGGTAVTTARGVRLLADSTVAEASHRPWDAVVLPGGAVGAQNLADSEAVRGLLLHAAAEGHVIAAICAAPALVLSPLGLLQGKRATCYPSMRERLDAGEVVSAPVVTDGTLITSEGPGTALQFGLAVVEALVGSAKADEVARAMLVTRDAC